MMIQPRNKLNKYWLVIVLFFCCNLLSAQQDSLLDSIAIKIESKIPNNWRLEKFNDSILILKRNGYIPYGYRDIRRTTDSLQYKLFIILREKKKDEATHIKEFVDLILKLQSESDTSTYFRHIRGSYSFDQHRKYLFKKYLPYQIPPNLFFSNYTLTIFDNVRSGLHVLKPKEATKDISQIFDSLYSLPYLGEVEREIYDVIQNIALSLSYDKRLQFYQNYIPCYAYNIDRMTNTFGGVHWGILRLLNYPQLQPFFE